MRIPLTIEIRNRCSTDKEYRMPEARREIQSPSQNVLESLTWGDFFSESIHPTAENAYKP